MQKKYITKEETAGCAQSDGGKVGDFEKQCDRTGWIYRIYTSAESASWRADEHFAKKFLITVEMDGREDAFRYTHPYSVVCTQ